MGYLSKIIGILGLGVIFSLSFGGAVNAQGAGGEEDKPVVTCNLSSYQDESGKTLENKSWFLPDCAVFEGQTQFVGKNKNGVPITLEMVCGCRNVNVLIQLLINIANKILMVVGGVALLVFIYGGFLILTAAGGEGVKKGKEALVAAVIGLVIIFSAQLLLNFVLSIVIKAGGQEGVKVEGVKVEIPANTK